MRDIYAMKGMTHLRLTSAAIAKMRWIYISHRIRLTTRAKFAKMLLTGEFPAQLEGPVMRQMFPFDDVIMRKTNGL